MNNASILILSSDKYSDLWKPFFSLFKQRWPDCPYSVFLGSNTKTCSTQDVTTVCSGEDKDWSSSYRKILLQIPNDYVLVILEDFFLTEDVDTQRIARVFDFMEKNDAKHIHIEQLPRPTQMLNEELGIYDRQMPYRVNVVGFWNKKYLENLLLDGESPWNFEIMGSYRSCYDDGFFCCRKKAITLMNMVEKGYWFREAAKYCQDHNVPIDDSRPALSLWGHGISQLKKKFFDLIIRINWKYRLKVMNYLRKILISY